jgi:predicted nucleic acid-binding protein
LIFVDTNVVSEALRRLPHEGVMAWLLRYDIELAMPTVAIAEISYGIHKLPVEHRSERLVQGFAEWRRRFSDRTFGLTEEAALTYGEIMGNATRQGRSMSPQDGMIAAIARVNGGRLATRNIKDFATTDLKLTSPWDF